MRISVLSMFRDSEQYLSETLKNLESLESHSAHEIEYFFYENDSVDRTVEVVREWLSSRRGDMLSEVLGKPKFSQSLAVERQVDMTYYRNQMLSLAKPLTSDYCLILDSDVCFPSSIIDQYVSLFEDPEFSDVVMITPNILQNIKCKLFDETQDTYYDSFALIDRFDNNGMVWTCNPFFNSEDRSKWDSKLPVDVKSAFGGCPIIKSNVLNEVEWTTDGGCEHWNFCRDIGDRGRIIVAPSIEVRVEISSETLSSISDSHIISVVEKQRQRFDLLQNFC